MKYRTFENKLNTKHIVTTKQIYFIVNGKRLRENIFLVTTSVFYKQLWSTLSPQI